MKTQEELNKVIENEELGNVSGGRINPTWLPVDEVCREINKGTTCYSPGMKGHCANCCDCIHNN